MATSAVHALGLRSGIAFPQLLVCDDSAVRVVEVAARIPGRPDGRPGAPRDPGLDLVEIALRQALGVEVPDETGVPPLLPAAGHPLPDRLSGPAAGRTPRALGRAGARRQGAGVDQADVFLAPGETIRPVRLDGDRRGYVIAVADTNLEALERAEAAAALLDVEVEAPVQVGR